MASQVTPYTYRAGNTFLHRVPGGVKLLGLLFISIGAFFSVPGLLIAMCIIILGAFSAQIRPWELLHGSRPLLLMGFVITLFRSIAYDSALMLPVFNQAGFFTGLLFSLRILISFSAGSLLFSVTTMMELKDSISKAEIAIYAIPVTILRKSKKKWAVNAVRRLKSAKLSYFSLGLSLMLGFLPRFFEIWEDAHVAYRARAGKKGVKSLVLLIPLVTERMMEMAMETATALEARGVSL